MGQLRSGGLDGRVTPSVAASPSRWDTELSDTARPPRVRARLSRTAEAQQAVKQLIVDRHLSSGDALPTESELMQELNVSRNSIREAVKALQAVGIVEIRHGLGMFVGHMTLTGLVDELVFHSRITLANGQSDLGLLIEIRQVLECGLLQKLISEHPAADHTAVARIVRKMAGEAAVGDIDPDTDKLFHESLYEPLNNALIGQLLGAFWDVYQQLGRDLRPSNEEPWHTVHKHEAIYRAVVARDVTSALAAMREHFDGVRSRLETS